MAPIKGSSVGFGGGGDMDASDGRAFRPVVLAELATRTEYRPEDSPVPRRFRLDGEGFKEALAQWGPRLAMRVDHCAGRGELSVELTVSKYREFQPRRIAQQIPVLAELEALRERAAKGDLPATVDGAMDCVGDGLRESTRIRNIFEQALADAGEPPAPTPAPPPPDPKTDEGDAADRIMGMLSGDEATANPAKDALGGLIRDITGTGGGPAKLDKDVRRRIVAGIDELRGEQLGAVLGHPEFRRLERTWRSLRHLVDRVDTGAAIRMDVIPYETGTLEDTFLEQLVIPEATGQAEHTPDIVVIEAPFGAAETALPQLLAVATAGAAIQAPVVASVGSAFFGEHSLQAVTDAAHAEELGRVVPAGLSALREEDAAQWLMLATNGFLATAADEEDDSAGTTQLDPLFLPAGIGVAGLLLRSQCAHGWPTHVLGPRSGGRITDLPVRMLESASGPVAFSLEAVATEVGLKALQGTGITCLVQEPGSDSALLLVASTAAGSPLPDQVVHGIVSKSLLKLQPTLRGLGPEGAGTALHGVLKTLLATANDRNPQVRVAVEPDDAHGFALVVDAEIPRSVVPSGGRYRMRLHP